MSVRNVAETMRSAGALHDRGQGARQRSEGAALHDRAGRAPGSVQGDVLLLSERRIADLVAYCLAYEFEDVVAAVTGAHRIDVTDRRGLELSRKSYKLARLASRSPSLARRIAPYPQNRVMLDRDFELFFPVFNHTYELYSLATIPNWRARCRKAACFIAEVWSDRLPTYLVELLSGFDHVFVGFRHSVQDLARVIGRPCTYLPYAADVVRFAPAAIERPRPIHVCNIGRRSAVTHQALIENAEEQESFYYYDTVAASGGNGLDRTFRVDSAHDHRGMLATILKHSQYYIANRSYVNNPAWTADRDEISARFYEGAAAGTVMIGEPPRIDEFRQQFDWEDALIHLPFDSPDVVRILADLDGDAERLHAARRRNVREAALRHDWLHRLLVVFETLGLTPTDEMIARRRRLDAIASTASAA